ncbi:MAG: ABC transporter ATP-binding protein/permease [Oscillospiraceae bacterium]|jgi:ATP-binding cassette subfamily B protein|nr:ABC transporter ATP-binding protein/permease [Oscillospiraceae bacterium]
MLLWLRQNVIKTAFRASPVSAALFVLLSVVSAVIPTVLTALATANFVDTAAVILGGTRPRGDITAPLVFLLLTMGAQYTVGAVVSLLRARIGMRLQNTLRPAVVTKHAALDFKHIENAESWELISRVSANPVASVLEGFGAYVMFAQLLVGVVSVLILIVSQVWWAAFVILAFSVPLFWLSVKAGKKNYQAGRDAEKFNRRTWYLDWLLVGRENIEERALFGYGEDVARRWEEQYEAGRILQLRVRARYFFITKGGSLIIALISLLVMLILIQPVVGGVLSAGMFMGIVGAVFGMVNQIGWNLSYSLENISKAGEFVKDLRTFAGLSEAPGASDLPDPEPMEFSAITFRSVRFKYPGTDVYVLDGVSFTLERGKHYAFVGKNGAGKTTVTKLLTGLYPEYEGEILIDGRELRSIQPGALKAFFSVIYQDYAKYAIPLRDNIALGDASGADTDARIQGAVAQAGLEGTVSELKDGLATPLGKILEGGQDISGGQWQRVAIARSLLSRAPVKILDEPTASLDPVSESRIYEEFEKLMRGKTTVFISHRLGSTKLADEILVFSEGVVAERGPHRELMERSGLYTEMFESQRGWYQ